MPEKMERDLKAKARSKDLSGKRANAYVYGTMRKTGWKPDREKIAKSRQGMMDAYAKSRHG